MRKYDEHFLHVHLEVNPVKKTMCLFSEKRKTIGEEIAWLLVVGFIMEAFHPDWLANPVLVLKKSKTWCMCIDYTSLNTACPKDPFALNPIDQVIDPMAGCELSFLDTYSGNHQIKLNLADRIKTTIITHFGVFCYISWCSG